MNSAQILGYTLSPPRYTYKSRFGYGFIGISLFLCFFLIQTGWAQSQAGSPAARQKQYYSFHSFGFRFASEFNSFFAPETLNFINHAYSNIVIGPFYKYYNNYGSIETGINFLYKNRPGEGNLPLVMNNFDNRDPNNPDNLPLDSTAVTGLELEFKVSPHIWKFIYFPKFGLTGGYWFKREGFLVENGDYEINGWYATLPVGLGLDFRTGFGTTGISIYYEIGLSNIVQDQAWDQGGKIRSWNFEIHVAFATGPRQ